MFVVGRKVWQVLPKQNSNELSTLCLHAYKNVSHECVTTQQFFFHFVLLRPLSLNYHDMFYVVPTALSMDGQLLRIVPGDTEIDDFVQEIEQHDYLMVRA